MKKSIHVKSVLVALALPILAGCIEPAPPEAEYPAAPPDQVEVMPPSPDPAFIWVGGSWEWSGDRWVWYGGRWAPRPHPGAVWVHGHWAGHHRNRVWVGAHWD